jgi:hypothetical protein
VGTQPEAVHPLHQFEVHLRSHRKSKLTHPRPVFSNSMIRRHFSFPSIFPNYCPALSSSLCTCCFFFSLVHDITLRTSLLFSFLLSSRFSFIISLPFLLCAVRPYLCDSTLTTSSPASFAYHRLLDRNGVHRTTYSSI